jgi:hypothetical protein
MVRDVEIGWLAGVLDGEGSITMSRPGKERASWHAAVFITNTDLRLLQKAQEILFGMGIEEARLHLHDRRYSKAETMQNRPCYRIYVGTCAGMRRLLEAVLPQLTAKREQAILLLEYLSRRQPPARTRANARDHEIGRLLSLMNRGHEGAVETERPPGKSQMSQSELTGDRESAAETTAPVLRRVK